MACQRQRSHQVKHCYKLIYIPLQNFSHVWNYTRQNYNKVRIVNNKHSIIHISFIDSRSTTSEASLSDCVQECLYDFRITLLPSDRCSTTNAYWHVADIHNKTHSYKAEVHKWYALKKHQVNTQQTQSQLKSECLLHSIQMPVLMAVLMAVLMPVLMALLMPPLMAVLMAVLMPVLCQNTKFSRSRHWKWSWLADDDLPPLPEKNQQTKTHKTQVWPRKAERSQRVRNLPSYDRWEVCTSHHHEQRRYRHRFNVLHLQHSSDWNSQWDSRQTSSEDKKLGHCRNSWSVRQKERTGKEKIRAWRSWEIQGSEQHQEVHAKKQEKTG